tara:strand:- start:1488 stop:1901 length:414 start_codon:yes stop_codon:yes gene_type:complete
MNKKQLAYAESVINELSEMLDDCYQSILDNKEFEMPDFVKPLKRKKMNEKQTDLIVNVFTEPFLELYKLDEGEDEELNKKYDWLSEEKRNKLISVIDALVTACVSEYTELQPEVQELKENFRKIAENEKEKAQQEEQ